MSKSEVVYAGKFLEMVKQDRWEFCRRVRGVSAVGIIAVTEAGELILVEQSRIPLAANTIELPAGLVGDDSAGEEIEAAARRELLEETGFAAEHIEYLYDGPSSAGLTDEVVHLVLARDVRETARGGGVGGEQITVHRVAINDLDAFLAQRRASGIHIDFKVRLAGLLLKNPGRA